MTEKPRKSKATHWLITGDDDFAIQQRAAELMKVNAPEDPMCVEVISGHIDSVDAAIRQTASAIEALLAKTAEPSSFSRPVCNEAVETIDRLGETG